MLHSTAAADVVIGGRGGASSSSSSSSGSGAFTCVSHGCSVVVVVSGRRVDRSSAFCRSSGSKFRVEGSILAMLV